MYRIIGVDGKEYGPVTAAQLRQWLADGRLNAGTMVRAEGSNDWRPLAQFPELAGAAAPPVGAAPAHTALVIQTTPGAEKKLAAGICAILLGQFGIHKFILGYTGAGLAMLLVTILTCGIGGVVMWVIGLIEGIIYLTKSDADFVATYVHGRKDWF